LFPIVKVALDMHWKAIVKKLIPKSILNYLLLRNPWLYGTSLVNYETNLYEHNGLEDLLAQLDLTLDVEGNLVECGCSRCGATVIMARHLKSKMIRKTIYACDSFEGFDKQELEKERREGLTTIGDNAFTSTSFKYIKEKINVLGVDDYIIPLRGYFEDTLPELDTTVSFALIDCDLMDSLIYCAEELWKRLTPNGRIIFDDYTSEEYRGARLGVNQFVRNHIDEISSHGLLQRLYFVCKG
jgi:hypothetical protein